MKNLFSLTLMFALVAFISTTMSAQTSTPGTLNVDVTKVQIGPATFDDANASEKGLQLSPTQMQQLQEMARRAGARGLDVKSLAGEMLGKILGISKTGVIQFDTAGGNDDGNDGSKDGTQDDGSTGTPLERK